MALLLLSGVCGAISFIQHRESGSGNSPLWQQAVGSFLGHQMEREYFEIPRYLDEGDKVSG